MMKRVVTAVGLTALCVGCGGYESRLEADRAARKWVASKGRFVEYALNTWECGRVYKSAKDCNLIGKWEHFYRECEEDAATKQFVCFSYEGDPALSDGVVKSDEELDRERMRSKAVKRFRW